MAWSDTLVLKLRYYINDIDASNYTWTDIQLQNFIVIAMIQVQDDVSDFNGFTTAFTLTPDATSPTIDPDPTDSESDILLSLVILRAACIMAGAELKKAGATGGYRIVDDKSTIDTKNQIAELKEMASWTCNSYQAALQQYKSNQAFDGRGILAPYSDPAGQWYSTPPVDYHRGA